MKEQSTPDKIVMSKKEIVDWLKDKEQWWYRYGNPFEEAEMVTYIWRGLEALDKMKLQDDDIVTMYPDDEGELAFRLGDK